MEEHAETLDEREQAPQPDEPVTPESTSSGMKLRLSVMMFLQYFVQGCYLPIVPLYLEQTLGFSKSLVGVTLSALAVGPLITPFMLGQLVDRRYATQHVLAFSHLAGGVTMLLLYTQGAFWPVAMLGVLYSLLYVPSLMLTNSLAFHHLRNSDQEFPRVRLWGTIGFILPAWLIEPIFLSGLQGEALSAARGIVLVAAGISGLVMGIYSLLLPHTPPVPDAKRRFAPGVAVGLLRQRRLLVLVLVSFVVAITHKYYFTLAPDFLRVMLRSGGVETAWEFRIMSLGQIAEIAVMAALGLILLRLGFKWTLQLGIGAYLLRCLIFALAYNLAAPFPVTMTIVCIGVALHGLCFACFMAAAFMYLDRTTPSDVRGSVQNLYGTFVIGAGFFVGGTVSGLVGDAFGSTIDGQQVYNWTAIWLTGAASAAACWLAFGLFFPRGDDTTPAKA